MKVIQVPIDVLKSIQETGEGVITLSNGKIKRITMEDLLVDKKKADALLKKIEQAIK